MSDDVTKPQSGLFSIFWLCAIHLENDICRYTSFLINTKYEHVINYKPTLPKVLAIDDDESVISSTTFSLFSFKKSRLRIIPSLSIFGDCRSTSRLSTFSKCNITLLSDSINEYVQNLAHLPGESHLPSPHSTKSFIAYFSTTFDYYKYQAT